MLRDNSTFVSVQTSLFYKLYDLVQFPDYVFFCLLQAACPKRATASYARIVKVAVPRLNEDGEIIILDSRNKFVVKVHYGCSAFLEFLGLELSRWWENRGSPQ